MTGCLLSIVLLGLVPQEAPPPGSSIRVEASAVTGIGREDGVCRRDPSDVIRLGRLSYVFYTKVVAGARLYPSGYGGTVHYATSSDGGRRWTERGEAVGRGNMGGFDSTATFTPNVVRGADGGIYVYYTGVGDGFDNRDYGAHNRTAVGVARVELDASGKLVSSVKLNDGRPVLTASPAASRRFDSFRVDDAALVIRDGRYWLYYKGRAFERTPRQTKMGLAIAKEPAGPYVRQEDGWSVQPAGHEVLVWAQKGGVFSLVTNAGRGLWFARDGVQFEPLDVRLPGALRAPGAFRPELVEHGAEGAIRWGIGMATYGRHPYLERFTLEWPERLPPRPGTLTPRAAGGGKSDWRARHRDINRIGATRPLDLVFLGDSITQSWGGPGAEVWKRYYGGRRAANFGISGDRTQHVLWRIDHGHFDHARPKVVVLQIGTRNLPHDSPEDIAEGVAAIVGRLRREVPAARVLLVGVFRGPKPDDPTRAKARAVNQRLARLAHERRVFWLDLERLLLREDGTAHPSLVRADGVHLTKDGYSAWAEAMEPRLRELLGEK